MLKIIIFFISVYLDFNNKQNIDVAEKQFITSNINL